MLVRELNALALKKQNREKTACQPQPTKKPPTKLLSVLLEDPEVNKKKAITAWLKVEIEKINSKSKMDF